MNLFTTFYIMSVLTTLILCVGFGLRYFTLQEYSGLSVKHKYNLGCMLQKCIRIFRKGATRTLFV